MSTETKEKDLRPIRDIMREVMIKSPLISAVTIDEKTTMASLLTTSSGKGIAWGRPPSAESKSERKDFKPIELCCKYRPAGSQSAIYHDMAKHGVAAIPFPYEALSKQLPTGAKYAYLQSAVVECAYYDGETARLALANPVSNAIGDESYYHIFGPDAKHQGVFSTDTSEADARVGIVIERCKSTKAEVLVQPVKFPGLTPALARSVDSVLGESSFVAPQGMRHERQPGSKELVAWISVTTEAVKASELVRIVFAYWPALKQHADAQLHGLLSASSMEASTGMWVSLYREPLEHLVYWLWHREGRHRVINLVNGLPLCLQALGPEEWDGVRSAIVRESGKFVDRCMSFDLKIEIVPLSTSEVDASQKDDNCGNPATIIRVPGSQKSSALGSRRLVGPAGGFSRLPRKY